MGDGTGYRRRQAIAPSRHNRTRDDAGAAVTVDAAEPDSGLRDRQPVAGTVITADGTAGFGTGVTDIFEPLDDSAALRGADGAAFEISWSWQIEGAADLKAAVTAGPAATQVQSTCPDSDFPAHVVTLKTAAQ